MSNKSYGKRKFNYHSSESRKRRKYCLDTGMRGFLCTCNHKERECVREAYNILNDYGDKLFGEEKVTDKSKPDKEEEKEVEIEDELQKEVESLKSTAEKGEERRFQVIESGANSCIFIKTQVPDPVRLVSSIMEDVDETKQQKTKHLIRLLPIEVTCKAYLDDIKKASECLFDKYYKCEPTTYAIVFNKRNNNNVLRDEVVESLARMVQDRNILHKADLRQAKLTVVVEVIKSICCVSVVPDYFKFCKYNLILLSKPKEEEAEAAAAEAEEGSAKGEVGGTGDGVKDGKEGEAVEKKVEEPEETVKIERSDEKANGEEGGGGDGATEKT